MYEQFDPVTDPDQLLQVRFNEYMDRLYNNKASILYHISEMDWWTIRNIIRPLSIEGLMTYIHDTCFDHSSLIATIVDALVVRKVRSLVEAFLGTPLPGDVVFAGMDRDQADDEDGNIFGTSQLMRQIFAGAEKAASEAGRTAAAATFAPPKTRHATESVRL